MIKSKATIGGIISHFGGGYGFKITFENPELARYYKEMIEFILKSESRLKVKTEKAYHDKKVE